MTTESDRELLELAAKAAGIILEWDGLPDKWQPMYYKGKTYHQFDPLTDDGDAMWIANELQLTIKFHCGLVLVGHKNELFADEASEDYKYAIVRAAAAIARATHKEQI